MNEFMNEPIPYQGTEEDFLKEYEQVQNKRKVAKIWGITLNDVNRILKKEIGCN